jgi:hypothetical protein
MMYPKIMLGIFSCLFFLVLAIAPVMAAGQDSANSPGSAESNSPMGSQDSQSQGQQTVLGTVDKVSDGSLTLKTMDGLTKDYTIKSEKKSEIKGIGLKKGDRVVAQVDAQNQIVNVTREVTGG